MKDLPGRLLLLAGGTLAALVVGECAVRHYVGDPLWPLVPPEPYVDNAVLYREHASRRYELRPGVDATVGRDHVRIRTNAAGFRDDTDYPEAKPGGTRRILVLGDSFTFAGKVSLEATFSKVLEGRLNASDRHHRYEVLNLAVPGYNTEQEQRLLEERGLRYEPDVIVVNFVLNDALRAGQLVPLRARFPTWARRILKRSSLVQFLYASSKHLEASRRGGRFKGAADLEDLSPGTPGFRRVRDALRAMQRASSERGARLLLAVWPMLEQLGPDYPFADKHRLVLESCRELGVEALDLYPTFAGRDVPSLWVARDDHHPNPRAQALAADAVFHVLADGSAVPEATTRSSPAATDGGATARNPGRAGVP